MPLPIRPPPTTPTFLIVVIAIDRSLLRNTGDKQGILCRKHPYDTTRRATITALRRSSSSRRWLRRQSASCQRAVSEPPASCQQMNARLEGLTAHEIHPREPTTRLYPGRRSANTTPSP